jgi:S-adenosylmethionine decarboxylase
MKIINQPVMHKFETEKMCLNNPGGISGIALLCESHVSIHTYPETQTIYADIFSCRDLDKGKNIEFIKKYNPKSIDIKLIHRN